LSKIIKSPRKRTQKTFDLLFQDYNGERDIKSIPTETTEYVREWDYGKYEGITSHDIHKEAPSWNIFDDGCPEGESVQEISQRVDKVIDEIRQIHTEYWKQVQKGTCQAGTQGGDVLIVTHGHFSKCFLARWCELPLRTGRLFHLSLGGYHTHHCYDTQESTLWWMLADVSH
jgi:probable phosphoglycerate mutase